MTVTSQWASEWPIGRLKNVLAAPITDGPHSTPEFIAEGVPFLSVDAIQNGELVFAGCRYVSVDDHADFVRKARPRMNDLLMGKAASTGKIARVKTTAEFSIWSPLALIRIDETVADPGFIEYCLKAPECQFEIDGYSNANTQKNIGMGDIPRISLPLPALELQNAAARFLDRETAQIDELIGKQERLIELLAEKRQAVITHAVIKGLDPNAPLRPSGIPGLESIPAAWETKQLKHIVAMRSGESITAEDIESIGDYPVFGGNGLRGYTSAYTHEGEYALIGRQGALCGNVNLARGQFWASEHAIVPTPRIQISVQWLFHMLKWMNLGQYSMTAAQPGISADAIGRLPVPFPSFDEQEKIAVYIERQASSLDRLTGAATSAVQLLRERRSALVSAAVTGKIDVREGAE